MSVKVKRVGKGVNWNKDIDATLGGKKMLKMLAGIIVEDIKNNLKNGKSYKGGSLKRLRATTVKQKRKKGYSNPSKPLIATGMMMKLPPVKSTKGKATIGIAKKRVDIAQYHDKGMGNPKREWFGISKKAERRIERALKKKAVGILKAGRRI